MRDDDVWIVRLSGSGEIRWQKCYGGNSFDIPFSLIKTSDGGYAFTGDLDQALKWLERSYVEHEPILAEELSLGAIEPLPNFVALANIARYDEMLHRVNLPSVHELRAALKRYSANGDDRQTQSKAVK